MAKQWLGDSNEKLKEMLNGILINKDEASDFDTYEPEILKRPSK